MDNFLHGLQPELTVIVGFAEDSFDNFVSFASSFELMMVTFILFGSFVLVSLDCFVSSTFDNLALRSLVKSV